MAPQIASPPQERQFFLFQNNPRGEGNCAATEQQKLSRGNFCLAASRCLSGPSGRSIPFMKGVWVVRGRWGKTLRTPRPVSQGVSRRVSPKTRGVRRSVPRGVTGTLRNPGSGVSKKCPESVPRVSGHLFDTPGTLSGHFLDTPEPGLRRVPVTIRGTLRLAPPVFGDTLRDTPRDTSGLKGPKDSCSWPGSLPSKLSSHGLSATRSQDKAHFMKGRQSPAQTTETDPLPRAQ